MKIPPFMLTDKVDVQEYLGNSAYGEKFDTAKTMKVRIEDRQKVVKNEHGIQIVSETTIISNQHIPIESKISFNQRGTKVVKCIPMSGFGGVSHYEVVVE